MSINTSTPPPNTIVLIHGLWMTPLSWEHWIDRYERAGYNVLAPAWPGMEGTVAELRANTAPYARLEIPEILDHYSKIIERLDSPPIIMGHSFGGAFTEILLDRGLGAAGVGIDPAAVKGVLSVPFSTIRSTFPVLGNPANAHKAVMLTLEQFHYSFTNTLSEAESATVYDRYAVPGPTGVLSSGAFANFNPHAATRVDFHNDHRAPLLIIGGGMDHIVPGSVTREAAERFGQSSSVTEYTEYAGRSHYTLGQPGWEQVADHALAWTVEHGGNWLDARAA